MSYSSGVRWSKHLSRFIELLIRSSRDASTSGRQMSMMFQFSFEY